MDKTYLTYQFQRHQSQQKVPSQQWVQGKQKDPNQQWVQGKQKDPNQQRIPKLPKVLSQQENQNHKNVKNWMVNACQRRMKRNAKEKWIKWEHASQRKISAVSKVSFI